MNLNNIIIFVKIEKCVLYMSSYMLDSDKKNKYLFYNSIFLFTWSIFNKLFNIYTISKKINVLFVKCISHETTMRKVLF